MTPFLPSIPTEEVSSFLQAHLQAAKVTFDSENISFRNHVSRNLQVHAAMSSNACLSNCVNLKSRAFLLASQGLSIYKEVQQLLYAT